MLLEKTVSGDAPSAKRDALTARLQDLLHRLASKRHVKHAIVAVERGDRSFRWIGVAGEANPDGTPMRADTPFFAASVTKLYTAAVVLKLHERGRIDLDAPVTAYLPPALTDGLHRLGGTDYTEAITVRHLLGHTSGLPDYFGDRPRDGLPLAERLFLEGDAAWDIEDIVRMVRDRLTPHFPPQPADVRRQKVRYSDTNYQLLGAIVEAQTDRPLHEVFEDHLLRPLGLRDTHLFGHTRPLTPTPAPATLWNGDQPLDIPRALRSMSADGGLVATADDMLAFLRALIRGEVFDDPTTFGLMTQRWNRFGFPRDRASLRLPGWPIEYGLGLMRFRLPRLFTPFRPVPAVIGHTGSSGSWLFYCPALDLYLCGTVDQVSAAAVPYRFVPKLLRVMDSSG